MNRQSKLLASILSALLLLAAMPIAASAADTAPKLVLTEICYNPTYIEGNDKGLEDTADVLEYIEFVNISSETVSLEGISLHYSTEGYGGAYKKNEIIPMDGSSMTLAAGEIAVVLVYNADTAKAGLGYATADERQALYDFFVEFYACAEVLDANRFYIAPAVESGSGTEIEGASRLTNQDENVALRVCDKNGATLCETGYNAATWNRNWFSMNLFYREGIVEGHPLASKDYNIAGTTPGTIRANQITAEGLAPTGETTPLKVLEYNVCAENTVQTFPDGTQPTMDERISLVFDYIRATDADVIGLTEINYLWVPRLEAEMTQEGSKYSAYGRAGRGSTYGSGRYSGQKWDLFNLILWNNEKYDLVESGSFWGSSTPTKLNTCNWPGGITGDMGRAMNWVILKEKATGLEFFFLCAHLDAKNDEVRTLSAELIRNQALELAGERPIIMVGDWNANERRAAYAELTKDGFDDARYRTADYADMTVYNTYNKWGEYTDQHTTRPPIDHCFITTANVFVDSALMDPVYIDDAKTMYASDHNATIFSLLLLLPKSEEPEVTKTDAPEPPTEPMTDPTTEPDTAGDAPEAPTDPTDSSDTEKSGCGSTLLPAAVLLPVMAAITLRKRRED